jgi:hypothetical protein
MSRLIQTASLLSTTGSLALVLTGNAIAAPNPSAGFGQHVAMCAQEHLGEREGAPRITCSHDGMTMTFPTFGAMVRDMQEMHAG